MRAARRKRVEAGGQQEDEQRPVVGLRPEALASRQRQEAPQEVPAAGTCSGHRTPSDSQCSPRARTVPVRLSTPLSSRPKPGTEPPSPSGQEVSPDVDGLVGHLEGAEDTVQGRAGGAAVARHDTIFPEHLGLWGAGEERSHCVPPFLSKGLHCVPPFLWKQGGREWAGDHNGPKVKLNPTPSHHSFQYPESR